MPKVVVWPIARRAWMQLQMHPKAQTGVLLAPKSSASTASAAVITRVAPEYDSAGSCDETTGTICPATPTQQKQSFYRRPLPSNLVPFASEAGKQLFQSSLRETFMEGYFGLAGNFMTQAEPAYCGLSCLAMVLNTLEVDPGRTWKGAWRWYSEEMLDCCAPLPRVKEKGITFIEFACLAQCNGLAVETQYADASSKAAFLQAVKDACSSKDRVLVVSYSRQSLQQTGDGHFSPIGGYDPASEMVLVMDVARFKYPSYWVPLELMWQALKPIDQETGRSRGYFVLTKTAMQPTLDFNQTSWPRLSQQLKGLKQQFNTAGDALTMVRKILSLVPPGPNFPIVFRQSNQRSGLSEHGELTPDAVKLCLDAAIHPFYELARAAMDRSGFATSNLTSSVSMASHHQITTATGHSLSVKKTRLTSISSNVDVDVALSTIFLLALPLWMLPNDNLLMFHHCGRRLRDETARLRHQIASLESMITQTSCSCKSSCTKN